MHDQLSGLKVRLYMDEFVKPRRLHKRPGIVIFSCQINAYRQDDVELNEDTILGSKQPKRMVKEVLSPLATSFSYHIDTGYKNYPWMRLSRRVARDLSKIYQVFTDLGYEVEKIHPCHNVGTKLQEYIEKKPGHVMYASDILSRLRNNKLDRTYRVSRNMDVHYYVKESAGDLAKSKAEDIMRKITGELALLDGQSGKLRGKEEKLRLYSQIAVEYNRQGSFALPEINLPKPEKLHLDNFVSFASVKA